MFLLCNILFALFCGESSGGFTRKGLENTLAVVGDNVTLSCTVVETSGVCTDSSINFHWQRESKNARTLKKISICTTIMRKFAQRFSVSQNGYEWELKIQNVTKKDAGSYRCSVLFRPTHESQPNHAESEVKVLTVVNPVNTAVEPSYITTKRGGNASFYCQAQGKLKKGDRYDWYIYTKTEMMWKRLTASRTISLADHGRNITIINVGQMQNGTYACELFRGVVSLTRHRITSLLVVDLRVETTDAGAPEEVAQEGVSPGNVEHQLPPQSPSTDKLPTDNAPTGGPPILDPNVNIHTDNVDGASVDEAHIPSERQTESKASPTQSIPKRVEPDGDITETTSASSNSVAVTVAGVLAALVLILIIAFLLYFVIYKGRNETKARSSRKSHVAGTDETTSNVNGLVETQLDLEEAAPPTYESIPEGTRPSHSSKETSAEVLYAEPDTRVATSANPETVKTKETHTSVRDAHETMKYQEADSPSTLLGNIQKPKGLKAVIATKPGVVSGITENRQQSVVKPPEVKPYQPSRQQAGNGQQNSSPSTEDQQHRDRSKDDPRKRNVEGLIYADLDLKEQGQTVVKDKDGEESVYADIAK